MKERQCGTTVNGLVLSIQAQKLDNDVHVDNPSAAKVASQLTSAMRLQEIQATDPVCESSRFII